MFWYWIVTFFKYLGRDNTKSQIAFGVAIGMLLGLIPYFTLHWFLVVALLFVFRMNLLGALVSALGFSVFSVLLQPWFESLGFWILTGHPKLIPLFARAYHAPLIPYTSFNHSTVMGCTIVGMILFLPVFWGTQSFVPKVRERVHTFWLSTRIQRAYAHTRRLIH